MVLWKWHIILLELKQRAIGVGITHQHGADYLFAIFRNDKAFVDLLNFIAVGVGLRALSSAMHLSNTGYIYARSFNLVLISGRVNWIGFSSCRR